MGQPVIDDDDEGRLAVDARREGWMVGWYFDGEGEFGAMLGEGTTTHRKNPPPPVYSSANDIWIAEYAIYQAIPDVERCVRGFVFPTERKARAACAIAKRALADAQSNRTPEPWEALALAAGWTPPKKRTR